MAEGNKKIRRVSDEARKRKRERDKETAKTRVDLAKEFARWRDFKEESGCKTDSLFASVLLDW